MGTARHSPNSARLFRRKVQAMTDPIQFLIAAAFYHPAAPFLAVIVSLGLFSMAFIALDTRVREAEWQHPPRNHAGRADIAAAPVPSNPSDHLADAAVDCVPVLDTAHTDLLERLEDVVECLGRAQRVLPDIMLSRVLRVRADPDEAGMNEITQRALNRVGVDFGVFSYHGHLELALKIAPPADERDCGSLQLIEIALKQAGVPLICIPLDAPPEMLESRIKSAMSSGSARFRAA